MHHFPGELFLNTRARISISDAGGVPAFHVEAPVRHEALTAWQVNRHQWPAAHAFLVSALCEGKQAPEVSADGIAELRRIGLLVSQDSIPEFTPYSLQPLPDYKAIGETAPDHLLVPESWRSPEVLFAHDAVSGLLQPFRRAESRATATPCSRQEITGPRLDEPATVARFAQDGFVRLENLIPDSEVHELGRYFRALAVQGFLYRERSGGTHRFYQHNDPITAFWHHQLNDRISRLAGCATKPSYSFVSLYVGGGDLDWHTDRSPCEYTVTLLIDYAPCEPEAETPWPLQIRGRDGQIHAIRLRIGDALIFRGRELEHSRPVLPEAHRSTSLLFHFVHADYDGPMA